MFGFGDGRQFQNEIARTLGVEGNLVGTCLLEVGISWSHLKQMKRSGMSPEAALHVLAPSMMQAVLLLQNRFGPQPELRQLELALMRHGPSAEVDAPVVGRVRGVEIVQSARHQRGDGDSEDVVSLIPGGVEGAYALILCHDIGSETFCEPELLSKVTNIPEVLCIGIFERLADTGHLESHRDGGSTVYRLSQKGRPVAQYLRHLRDSNRLA